MRDNDTFLGNVELLSTRYPGMVALRKSKGFSLAGFVEYEGEEYDLELYLPSFPSSADLVVHVDGVRRRDLARTVDEGGGPSVLKWLDLLCPLLSVRGGEKTGRVAACGGDEALSAAVDRLTRHCVISRHLAELGWHRVKHIDSELRQLCVCVLDRGARCHQVTLSLGQQYPHTCPSVLHAQLPQSVSLSWPQCGGNLLQVYRQLYDLIEQYQGVWSALDRLERVAAVVAPLSTPREQQQRRPLTHTHTHLLLACGVKVRVMLDPVSATSVPSCRFIGNSRMVARLRERLGANIELWDEYDDVCDNLERVLNTEVVKRGSHLPDIMVQQNQMSCGICLCGDDDSDNDEEGAVTPSSSCVVVCERARCQQHYHSRCLVQWLESLVSVQRSGSVLCGHCPYCHAAISCNATS